MLDLESEDEGYQATVEGELQGVPENLGGLAFGGKWGRGTV